MYLEHFGLNEQPFKVTPVTDFFFSGANRGEILDALVYAITDGEGIVKISGEVGSGKTMLCRMLLDKLPTNIIAIYLANPSLSRDELLYAIADRLGLDLEGQRVNVILQNLQNDLEQKHARGERCVVLVDEAHAMPLETLEELRLLYNLQVGKHKLLQIVLFGQPELDTKLAQINMRQLKDRIVHHFTILPLSQQIIHAYLMFRMRAAGYKGPDIFTPAAEKMIGKASQGLMRRVNILADKSLLAAFVENTHKIDIRHVQAAIRDSEMTPMHHWLKRRNTRILGGLGLLAGCMALALWFLQKQFEPAAPANHVAVIASSLPASAVVPAVVTSPISAPASASAVPAVENAVTASSGVSAASSVTAASTLPNEHVSAVQMDRTTQATKEQVQTDFGKKLKIAPTTPAPVLLNARLEATRAMLASAPNGSASIQLFYTEGGAQERMEAFLLRAKKFKNLDDIYVLPIKLRGHDAYRVLYGVYATSEDARTGMEKLPKRYLDAFAPTLHLLDNSQNPP